MTAPTRSPHAPDVAQRPGPAAAAPRPPVWLVGAGPGDPELLTLRAARVIGEADVLLVDDLVDRRVLALARPEARVLPVGKRGGCVSTDQAFIHQLMVREAQAGRRVVRLKGGDPFVFGRGGEECDALRAAGLAVEVVSGLTAGVAGPAAIGMPVTDRRHAPGVAFVTGHAQDGGSGPDWQALCASRLTLVVYMGLSTVRSLVDTLMAHGLAADLPSAAIAAAHTPAQRSVRSPLARLPQALDAAGITSPAVLVIGSVASMGQVGLDFGLGLEDGAAVDASTRQPAPREVSGANSAAPVPALAPVFASAFVRRLA